MQQLHIVKYLACTAGNINQIVNLTELSPPHIFLFFLTRLLSLFSKACFVSSKGSKSLRLK